MAICSTKIRRCRTWRLRIVSLLCVVSLGTHFVISVFLYAEEHRQNVLIAMETRHNPTTNQSDTAKEEAAGPRAVLTPNDVRESTVVTTTPRVRPVVIYQPSAADRDTAAILSNMSMVHLTMHNVYNVTYNRFSFTLPNFATSEDANIFTNLTDNTDDLNLSEGESALRSTGMVTLINDGYASMDEDCGYKSTMTSFVKRSFRKPTASFVFLCPLLIPGGKSYQHFVDGVLPKIVQIYEILKNTDIPILLDAPRDELVKDMLRYMGFDRDRIVHYKTGYYAADFQINTCITPPLHPVLWQKARRILGVPETGNATQAPSVVFFVRRNVGRQIQNLKEVQNFLKERYKDRLKAATFASTLQEAKSLMGDASIIIGVHGGAFYNMLFTPPSAAIVEIMPVTKKGRPTPRNIAHKIFWQMAQTLGHSYWRMNVQTFSGRGDLVVPMDKLKTVLDRVDYDDYFSA